MTAQDPRTPRSSTGSVAYYNNDAFVAGYRTRDYSLRRCAPQTMAANLEVRSVPEAVTQAVVVILNQSQGEMRRRMGYICEGTFVKEPR